MKQTLHFHVIDADSSRRAKICFLLSQHGLFAEPLENPVELSVSERAQHVALVHDDGDSIERAIRHAATLEAVVPVVGYAEAPMLPRVVHAVRSGATDFLAWPFAEGDLSEQFMNLYEAGRHHVGIRILRHAARARLARLTRRERQVLDAVADGLSNRAIGERLQISPRTVEIHRANMLTKANLTGTADAIRLAIHASLPD